MYISLKLFFYPQQFINMKFIPELHAITLNLFSRNLILEFLMVIKPLAPAPQIKDAPHTDSHPQH